MSDGTLDFLISLKDVAEMVGVNPSAVSNWRRRFAGKNPFPEPRMETPAGSLFDFNEVQAWLLATGRISEALSPSTMLFNVADALRGYIETSDIPRFIMSLLVYLEACRRFEKGIQEIKISEKETWKSVRQGDHLKRFQSLRIAALNIEESNPALRGLIINGLDTGSLVPPVTLDKLVFVIENSVQINQTYTGLLRALATWRGRTLRREFDEHTTPENLARLMALIANTQGNKVFDPAVGGGSVFLEMLRLDPLASREFVGFEYNRTALEECRSGFFLMGRKGDLEWKSTLANSQLSQVDANVVVLDPPMAQRLDLSGAEASASNWEFGVPPRNHADFAWLQLAIAGLRPGGVALVLTSHSPAFRGGTDGQIREAMIAAGTVASIVSLPGRVRYSTPIPLLLWVLRRPRQGEAVKPIQLIDATALGRPGRPGRDIHQFSAEEVEALADAVTGHLAGNPVEPSAPFLQAFVAPSEVPNGDLLAAVKSLGRPALQDVVSLREQQAELRVALQNTMNDATTAVSQLLISLKETL